jgi:hypothetical protein
MGIACNDPSDHFCERRIDGTDGHISGRFGKCFGYVEGPILGGEFWKAWHRIGVP